MKLTEDSRLNHFRHFAPQSSRRALIGLDQLQRGWTRRLLVHDLLNFLLANFFVTIGLDFRLELA